MTFATSRGCIVPRGAAVPMITPWPRSAVVPAYQDRDRATPRHNNPSGAPSERAEPVSKLCRTRRAASTTSRLMASLPSAIRLVRFRHGDGVESTRLPR